MKLLPLLLVFFGVSLGEVGKISEDDDIELERQVKMMNRPPVKTFTTEEGDTIDCIDIDKQPSLQHPLLKNHKIQKEPTFQVTSFGRNLSRIKFVQFGLREPCPIGTVPILRVTKKDLIRARALPKMPSLAALRQDALQSNQHVISLVDNKIENIKYGAYGRASVYNISVASDQFSSHNIWIQTGPRDHVSMIVAGWMVSPQLYGDSLSRFFIYWTGNGYRDGCYDVLCPGFVLVNRGAPIRSPLRGSTYGGDQYEVSIHIEQDRETGNWWLIINYPPIKVGYWPKELFVNLQNGSLHVAWGGIGLAGSDGVCPPIGSGHKPDDDYTHATYFRTLQWVSEDQTYLPPSTEVGIWVDRSHVYDLKYHPHDRHLGYWMGYGGPGGYCRG
ncbi:uncharacterized protein LOC115678234 [Syzygium oleosum]|uniref:uncharacterized protein LOC115678234 n=1 Tax=Syzygium oleosum TaxID=219896 RepID=UPI0011D27558|nr:uncharacterized protein LOC115678234 [Syzygium oleosum]